MPKLSHMLNYSKTLPLQQPFCEIDEGKYYNYESVLAESTYFTGTQCLSLIALTLSTRRRYFSYIKGSVFSQVLTISPAIMSPIILAPKQRTLESVCWRASLAQKGILADRGVNAVNLVGDQGAAVANPVNENAPVTFALGHSQTGWVDKV